MAENIQSKINKRNAKSQSGILNWIGSFFEGPTEYHKRNKRKAQKKAKQLVTNANKENKAVSLTSLKKDIKEAVPVKGRDFEKPIKPKAKNKTKPKDIGGADTGRKLTGFRNKMVGKNVGMGETIKDPKKKSTGRDFEKSLKKVQPSQVSRGPAELANDASERKRDRSRNEKGRDVISKSAGSKKEGIGKQLAKALSGGQKKTKVGNVTIDSTDEGMSKFLGTKDEIRQQMEDEEMNFRKGGAVKKKYGMREGGFTKRGGMYKKGY